MFHPASDEVLAGNETGMWLAVHYAQLALAPLLALGMVHLLWPVAGIPAAVGRIAVVLWVALFSAFDAVAGIATGVLVDGGFEDAATHLFEDGLVGGGSVLGWVAQPMWIVVAIASGLALRTSGAPKVAWIAMFVSVLFATHAGWVAAIGLLALAVGFLGVSTRRPAVRCNA